MNELAKPQVCVLIRSGLEIWIDQDQAPVLEHALTTSTTKFLKLSGQLINTFEVLGVFTPAAMEDRQRRKNGQWKCLKGTWHEKDHKCECKAHRETVTAHVEGVGEITYKR